MHRRTRIALFAADTNGFVKPMAMGLARMLVSVGASVDIVWDGLDRLRALPRPMPWPRAPRAALRRLARRTLIDAPTVAAFAARFRRYDAVVVVNSVPEAFFRSFFCDQMLRSLLPHTPIVLYDVFYLPTRGHWWKWLRDGNPEAGIPAADQWGMQRYDWYLCASVVSEVPMRPAPQPCSIVGLNLDDGTLYPAHQGKFVALIDFAQKHHERERALQVAACEATDTPYIALAGRYSIAEIRQIYRRCSAYFVGFRESFGIPICELQACGSYVFLARAHWAPSHWLKPDLSVDGPGTLSSNFVVYDNDEAQLIDALRRVKATYDAQHVVTTFQQSHPQFFWGNLDAARDFRDKIRAGEIHSRSHEAYAAMPVTDYRGRFSANLELTRPPDGKP